MKRVALACICAFGFSLLASCAGIPYQTYDLVDDIAEDQASLNDAYGRALNGQILLNVLRSRDRWPRHYTNVSPMSDQPTIQSTGTLTLTPLGLGSAASPLAGSGAQIAHQESTRPSYGVAPLDSEAINRAVLSATKRSTFQNYWSSGWPRDVLLLVMVSSISRAATEQVSEQSVQQLQEGARRPLSWLPTLMNDGGALRECDDLAADVGQGETTWPTDPSGKCGFFQLAHRIANFSAGENRGRVRLRRNADPECQTSTPIAINADGSAALIDSLASLTEVAGNKLSVRLRDPNVTETRDRRRQGLPPLARQALELASCPSEDAAPVLLEVLGPQPTDARAERPIIATYYLELRSLDAMVYSMGEQLRGATVQTDAETGRARVRRTNGDLNIVYGGCDEERCDMTSLFRVFEGPVDRDEDYSAVVVHRGQRYFAGPATGEITIDGRGQPRPGAQDRTATVLTLLTQLFALNNSPGALAPIPARPVLD